MNVTVLYFGQLREQLAGVSRESLDVADGSTVAELEAVLTQAHPRLRDFLPRCKIAVNEEVAARSDILSSGAVVALLPPVAGGCRAHAWLSTAPPSVDCVMAEVAGADQGGTVLFIGTARNSSHKPGELRPVVGLDYEAYPSMAVKEMQRIVDEIESDVPGARVAIAHRIGELNIGDAAVVIAASAPHRSEAFDACRAAIEGLKQNVPIWKREVYPVGAEWISPRP